MVDVPNDVPPSLRHRIQLWWRDEDRWLVKAGVILLWVLMAVGLIIFVLGVIGVIDTGQSNGTLIYLST